MQRIKGNLVNLPTMNLREWRSKNVDVLKVTTSCKAHVKATPLVAHSKGMIFPLANDFRFLSFFLM